MNYSKRIDNKEFFKLNAFKPFIDECGGDLDEFTDIVYARYTIEDYSYNNDIYNIILNYFKKVVIPHKISVFESGLDLIKSEWIVNYINDKEKDQFIYNLWLHDISKFSSNHGIIIK